MNGHSKGPWRVAEGSFPGCLRVVGPPIPITIITTALDIDFAGSMEREANARLIAAAPELLAELQRAQDFIDGIRQELHQRRVADWYPEGAHNAAEQMSEDMRLLGNACADFDTSAAIAKATGEA
ncbi:hypothetical protein [Stenotrophomonas bentonitica]|uniref:hypothetical protein n=1 Tax=Stenotrophomonas bentonitica TaxID=1450134 RepID=UPI0031BBBCC7